MASDPLTAHRDAYEALWKAQEEAQERARDLEAARAHAIEHLVEKLAGTRGLKSRKSKVAEEQHTPGPLMVGQDGTPDPLEALLRATESTYFKQLGRERALPPLAIYHVNNWQGGPFTCPSCGETHDPLEIPAPDGTVGRGPLPGE